MVCSGDGEERASQMERALAQGAMPVCNKDWDSIAQGKVPLELSVEDCPGLVVSSFTMSHISS